jgi:hypothetical protein
MKKFITILSLSTVLFACQKDAIKNEVSSPVNQESSYNIPAGYTVPECVTPLESAFLAGQSINVGTVTVWNDETNVYVAYTVTGNYKLNKTHLFVGGCTDIPVNNAGNPRIGLYPYQTTHGTTGVSQYVYTIPRSTIPGGCLCVSAHAEVGGADPNGNTFNQTGWGQGPQVNDGGSWAMKMDYCQQDCDGNR